MKNWMHTTPSVCLAVALLLAPASAQQPAPNPGAAPVEPAAVKPAADKPQADKPNFVVRRYPQDKDVAIAVVGSRTLTLGELVDHIDSRHFPGFKAALPARPEMQRVLQSDLIAAWVRQFADMEALRQTFGDQMDAQKLEQAQSDALKAKFKVWLDNYAKERPQANLGQEQVAKHLSQFQWKYGTAAELQGMLDHLEPGHYPVGQLRDFFNDHARAFGGMVNIQHILVQHRDGGTGILLNDEGLALANQRIADIKARLRPDGSNFEEVALRSDDQKTGREGGKLTGVHRYDDRLPAAICRAAWSLRDGEISEPIESQYGWHIVRRVDFTQNIHILFSDDTLPDIRNVMRRAMQEERLFTARAKAGVRLLL